MTPKGRSTKESLLKAGEAVAGREGLGGLSVAAVTAQAGVAKGTFYVYFPDRDAFVAALHERFFDAVAGAVGGAVEGLEPGRELLIAAIEAYLEACLANHAIKAMILESRTHGGLPPAMADRVAELQELVEPSVRVLGLTPARISARLIMALTSEAALIELEAGQRVPAARKAIRTLLAAGA